MTFEWGKHEVRNRSLTAKAHCTFNSHRLGITVPSWCMPESDAEGIALLRMIEGIKADETARAEKLRRDHRERSGTQGPHMARDTAAQPGSRTPDPVATGSGDRDIGGDLERDELDDWRGGETADWPFDDDAGADRAVAGVQ